MFGENVTLFLIIIPIAGVISSVLCLTQGGWPLLPALSGILITILVDIIIAAIVVIPLYLRSKWMEKYFPMSLLDIMIAVKSNQYNYEFDAKKFARNMSVELRPEQLAPLLVATPEAFGFEGTLIRSSCAICRKWTYDQTIAYIKKYLNTKYGTNDPAVNAVIYDDDALNTMMRAGYITSLPDKLKEERQLLVDFAHDQCTLIHPSETDRLEQRRFMDLIAVFDAYREQIDAIKTSTTMDIIGSASGMAFVSTCREALNEMEASARKDVNTGIQMLTETVENMTKGDGV